MPKHQTSKNDKLLKEFTAYCLAHPTERFWQALLSWSGVPFLLAADNKPSSMSTHVSDTFFWQYKKEF